MHSFAYIREARRASMTLKHAAWRTQPIRAGDGLRQGFSIAGVVSLGPDRLPRRPCEAMRSRRKGSDAAVKGADTSC